MKGESSTKGADDLKLITGIGPKTERRLHEAGVATYAQLAAMSPADLAELLHDFAGMSAARIEEQGWVSQARDLVPEEESGSETSEGAPGNGQHYATFRIELLLDENSQVRRTRVGYIQGQEDSTWVGWESDRLVEFIIQRAALQPSAGEVSAKSSQPEARSERQPSRPTPLPANMSSSLDLSRRYALRPQLENLNQMSFTHGKKARAPGRGPAGSAPKESTSSGKLQVIPAGERAPSRVVRHDQVFGAHLTLEHPERLSREGPLDYTATLFAKSPGEPHVLTVGETSGTLPPGETIIKLNGRIVSPGVYRLEAHLTVAGATRSSTTLPGGFIHVY